MDDQGDPQTGLEAEAAVIEEVLVLAERFAVIGGDHRQGVLQQSSRAQEVEKLADFGVGVGDLGVVASHVERQIVAVPEHLLEADAQHLPRRSIPADIQLASGLTRGLFGEAVGPGWRCFVGKVGIQIMNPEKIGAAGIVFRHDGAREIRDHLGSGRVDPTLSRRELPTLDIGLEPLIEVELAGHCPVGHHGPGGVSPPLQHFGQHHEGVRETDPDLAHDPVVLGIGRGEHRGEGGSGLGPLHDGVIEADGLGGDSVEHRRGRTGVAVGGEMIGSQGVDADQKDIGGPGAAGS